MGLSFFLANCGRALVVVVVVVEVEIEIEIEIEEEEEEETEEQRAAKLAAARAAARRIAQIQQQQPAAKRRRRTVVRWRPRPGRHPRPIPERNNSSSRWTRALEWKEVLPRVTKAKILSIVEFLKEIPTYDSWSGLPIVVATRVPSKTSREKFADEIQRQLMPSSDTPSMEEVVRMQYWYMMNKGNQRKLLYLRWLLER